MLTGLKVQFKPKETRLNCYMSKEAIEALGAKEVVFDQHTKTIRPASIDDRKSRTISQNGSISVSPLRPDDFAGEWNCEVDNGVLMLYRS